MTVTRTIVRNTTYNALGRAWEAACNIVLTAYVVPRIGVASWGLWGLVSVFTGYMALFDMGMGSGFSKFIAERAAKGDKQGLSRIVSTGLFFYLLFGVALVSVCWPCIDALIPLFAKLGDVSSSDLTQTALLGDVRFLLRWGIVLFVAANCVASFSAVQGGLQRMEISNAISMVSSVLKLTATVIFIERGCGVRGLMYSQALVFVFFGAASFIAARTLAPGLRVSPREIEWKTFNVLFQFGWRTQVSRFSNLLSFQTDRMIVGLVYRKLGLVGVYAIGEELAGKMRQIPALLVSALLPAASDLDARGDKERLRRLYLVSSKYLAVATFPLVAFLVGGAGMLLRTWMGPSVPNLDTAAWVARILAAGYLCNILPGAGVSIALGKGRPDVQMKAGILSMVSNVAITIALVFPLGLYGAALGTSLSMFVACAWFFAAMRPLVDVGVRDLLRTAALWPAVASAPGFIACILGDVISSGFVGRVPNGIALVSCAAIFAASYLGVIRAAPFLDEFDVEFLGRSLGLRRVPGFDALIRKGRPNA
jgi:O-antigen/teichoic acid export membrane protein